MTVVTKQAVREANEQIVRSLALIESLGSNVEHYLPDLKGDLGGMENAANRLAEVIGHLREIHNQILTSRFQSLLPDSGVRFEQPEAGEGVQS